MKIVSRIAAPSLALTLSLLLALSGCGQKGPLYIPQPDQPTAKADKKAAKKAGIKAPAINPTSGPNPGTPTTPEPAPFGTNNSAASSSSSSAPATNPTPN